MPSIKYKPKYPGTPFRTLSTLVYKIEVNDQKNVQALIKQEIGKSVNFSSKLINVPALLFGTLEYVEVPDFQCKSIRSTTLSIKVSLLFRS